MKRRVGLFCILFTAILGFDVVTITKIQNIAKVMHLMDVESTKENLRNQEISGELYQKFCGYEKDGRYSRYEYLCGYLFTGEEKEKPLEEYLKLVKKYKKKEFSYIVGYEKALWCDLRYFPVPAERGETLQISFENSWMSERTFGGKRKHEGTDIMASMNQRGHYPVISISDGIIEKTGWLPQGGYRIGVRSPNGAYFYYAHLYDYAEGIEEGREVNAGELLGFMGDSGYGEEGTVANFDVHLHIGIYLNDENGEEFSINPYWIMKYLEDKRLTSQYE